MNVRFGHVPSIPRARLIIDVHERTLCLLVRGDELAAKRCACAEVGARGFEGAAQLFWHWYDVGIGPGRYG